MGQGPWVPLSKLMPLRLLVLLWIKLGARPLKLSWKPTEEFEQQRPLAIVDDTVALITHETPPELFQ